MVCSPILRHVPLSGHHGVALLNDVAYDVESTQNRYLRHAIASLKSRQMGKLIHRIPGSHLLISCLPGSASRMHVQSLCMPRDSTSVLKASRSNKRSQSLA